MLFAGRVHAWIEAHDRFEGKLPSGNPAMSAPTSEVALIKHLMEPILVGRYREVFEIYHVYASSIERATTPKPTIPVFPQFLGMGKTSVSLLFPQVIQRPPEVNDEERRRILSEVSESRFWSSEYEDLGERAMADKTTNVLVALLTARWEDNPRIKSVSCFATCKPLLIVTPSGACDDIIIMQRILSYFEADGRAGDTTDVYSNVAQGSTTAAIVRSN
jgi:hypothetical protein